MEVLGMHGIFQELSYQYQSFLTESEAWLSTYHLTVHKFHWFHHHTAAMFTASSRDSPPWTSSDVGAGGIVMVVGGMMPELVKSKHQCTLVHQWHCTVGGDSSCQRSSSSGSGSDRRQKKAAHIRDHITEEDMPVFVLCICLPPDTLQTVQQIFGIFSKFWKMQYMLNWKMWKIIDINTNNKIGKSLKLLFYFQQLSDIVKLLALALTNLVLDLVNLFTKWPNLT